MGSTWSAEDYHSDWERGYVTQSHNGSTCRRYGSPILGPEGSFDNLEISAYEGANPAWVSVPLRKVHGVYNLENLKLCWDLPLEGPGQLHLVKIPFSESRACPSAISVIIPIPEGSTELDLDGYRAAFVAYLDTLVTLEVAARLPGGGARARLSSTLGATPSRTAKTTTMAFKPGEEPTVAKVPVGDLMNKIGV